MPSNVRFGANALACGGDISPLMCKNMVVADAFHGSRQFTDRPTPPRVVFVETNDGICNDLLIFPNVIQNSSLYASRIPTYTIDEYGGTDDEQQLNGRNSECEGSVRGHSPEQIFEEIVRECEEIERRTSSSTHAFLSTDHPSSTISAASEKKKAQNRAAATRYRERKKRERELAKQNVLKLETYNAILRARVTEIQKEISYLHNLMEEVRSRSR